MSLEEGLYRELYKNKMAEQQKRQTAYKLRIADIVNGKYIKEEGWEPNYILTNRGLKVSRANIIATVISKQIGGNMRELVVEDGSAKIAARAFDESSKINADVGDIVFIVGRPREFGNSKYVLIEILKKLSSVKWLELRNLELKNEEPTSKNIEDGFVKEDIVEDAAEEGPKTIHDKIIKLVRELDSGDGVDYEDVVKMLGEGCESKIMDLLAKGDLFEIRSNRLKVL